MRLLSNQILKTTTWQPIQLGETMKIDNNSKVDEKLQKMDEAFQTKFSAGSSSGGFQEGLSAEDISAMVDASQMLDDEDSSIIKFDAAKAEEEAQARIQEMYDQAQAEIDQMKAETQEAYEKAQNEGFEEGRKAGYDDGLVTGKDDGLTQGHEEGFAQGHEEGLQSVEDQRQELEAEYLEKMDALESSYQKQLDEIEPRLMDTMTAVYEHVLKIDLKNNREMILHLINDCMKNVEGKTGFMIHVSKEDYPYVNMQKRDMVQGTGVDVDSVEMIEDASLHKNECMIETDGGVFDCSLGTQLDALRDELCMLAFQHTKVEL